MLAMPSFVMNTRPETFSPLTHCVVDDILSRAMPDLCQALLQFIDVMNLMSFANVSMRASMPKEDILAFNVTQKYTIGLQLLSTIRQTVILCKIR